MDRLQRLAERLALAQQEKVGGAGWHWSGCCGMGWRVAPGLSAVLHWGRGGPAPLFPPTRALNGSASFAPLLQVRAEEELAALQSRMEQLRWVQRCGSADCHRICRVSTLHACACTPPEHNLQPDTLPAHSPAFRLWSACRDEQSHEAEALLHELLVQRLRQSSAGDSNTASGGRAAGSGPEVRQPGGSGTAGGSAEATLALAVQAGGRHHMSRQPQPDSSNGSGGPSGGTLVGSAEGAPAAAVVREVRQEIKAAEQPRQRRPSTPAAAQPVHRAQQRQQRGVLDPPAAQAVEVHQPRLRPVAAPHLPLPLQQLQEAALSGGSGNNTPLSARSVESAWSDSGGCGGQNDQAGCCEA